MLRSRLRFAPAAALSMFLFSACDDDSSGGDGETDGQASTSSDSPTTGADPTSASGDPSDPSTTSPATSATATATTGDTSDPSTTATSTTADPTGDSEDTETSAGTDESTGTTGGAVEPPPTGEAALLPWLEAGNYTDWASEAEPHPSAGPHFTAVRTFVNAPLLESLEGGSDDHPVGAAVVKELFGNSPAIGGWAVMVKVAPGSSVDSWYWYESFEGATYADDTGVNGCGNCHSSGQDYIRTELPL